MLTTSFVQVKGVFDEHVLGTAHDESGRCDFRQYFSANVCFVVIEYRLTRVHLIFRNVRKILYTVHVESFFVYIGLW